MDFAAVAKEEMAILIASRKKIKLKQLLRKKIVICVAVRIKVDFAAVAKEKQQNHSKKENINFAGKLGKKLSL